jgi:hypothetical protein
MPGSGSSLGGLVQVRVQWRVVGFGLGPAQYFSGFWPSKHKVIIWKGGAWAEIVNYLLSKVVHISKAHKTWQDAGLSTRGIVVTHLFVYRSLKPSNFFDLCKLNMLLLY